MCACITDLWYTVSSQVTFAEHAYAVSLSLQAKHNVVPRTTEKVQQVPSASHSFQSKQQNHRSSSKDCKTQATTTVFTIRTARTNSSCYCSLEVKHLCCLASWLAEGSRLLHGFVKVEWISPMTECGVTWITGNMNKHQEGVQCT